MQHFNIPRAVRGPVFANASDPAALLRQLTTQVSAFRSDCESRLRTSRTP